MRSFINLFINLQNPYQTFDQLHQKLNMLHVVNSFLFSSLNQLNDPNHFKQINHQIFFLLIDLFLPVYKQVFHILLYKPLFDHAYFHHQMHKPNLYYTVYHIFYIQDEFVVLIHVLVHILIQLDHHQL